MQPPLSLRFLSPVLLLVTLVFSLTSSALAQSPSATTSRPLSDTGRSAASSPQVDFAVADSVLLNVNDNAVNAEGDARGVVPASMLQQTPLLDTRRSATLTPALQTGSSGSLLALPASGAIDRSTRLVSARSSFFSSSDRVTGAEAVPNASTDLGDLLRKSSSALSVGVQSKTPVVHDPRIRGSRVGSLAASGSYWVPARADLDTIVSRFDSRQIESALVIPGPYTALLGPGFAFTQVELLGSPRYRSGPEARGNSNVEYRANGDQLLAQQGVQLGSSNWGAAFNYVLRTGNDYRDGSLTPIPSSYNSQEMILALGRDWEQDSVEVTVLRQDQTDVIFPGYVFDIDFLVTDGYELSHVRRLDSLFEAVETDLWYNRTRFEGNAQNPDKRAFFPALDLLSYEGRTDVDSMSTGYRQTTVIGGTTRDLYRFSVGHDLRFIKQELNEISDAVTLPLPFFVDNRNSPIPQSYTVNPGLFAEYEEQLNDSLGVKLGGRVDYAAADISDSPDKLAEVGLEQTPATYAEVVGTDQYARNYGLISAFMAGTQQLDDASSASVSLGFAQRAPTLTELYAAQPFLLLLQNGLNNVTGDPTLKSEKLLQLDVGYQRRSSWATTGIRGFHAWAFDYITFENTLVTPFPPDAGLRQVSLRYVNTDFATLSGVETFTELFPTSLWTPFANLRYTQGTDHTRNGNFATTNGTAGSPSTKDNSQDRGASSGIVGGSSEPLPSLPPLDVRLGWRLHDTSPKNLWSCELSARLVDRQNRVATSLLESETPGFSTWDLRTFFRPSTRDNLLVAAGVENIFNRTYREHFDYRTTSGRSVFQPGTNVYMSLNLDY